MSGARPLKSEPSDLTHIETRFGNLSGNPRDVVTLVDGLPGFEDCRRFLLLSSTAIEPLVCLQGLDDSRPAFLAVDPRLVDAEYRCRVDDLQRRRLGASADTPLLWLAIVRVGEDGSSTVNLRAPLVVNPERMRAMQLLAGHDEYDTAHHLG
ncbi:MAG: flagellar assembly protein FliW [Vicinamibacterales bacterium]